MRGITCDASRIAKTRTRAYAFAEVIAHGLRRVFPNRSTEAAEGMSQKGRGMQQLLTYCFLKPNAVGADFLTFMEGFTSRNLDKFEANSAGAARKFYRFDSRDGDLGWPVLEIKEELARHFDLGPYEIPPKLKDFIGYITEGGLIHTHTDPDLPGKRHVRINVLLKQTAGCIPLMEDIPIDIPVGAAWLNLASKCKHGTTAVEGPGYRQGISFGYQIDPARGDELYEIHKKWRDEATQGTGSVAA